MTINITATPRANALYAILVLAQRSGIIDAKAVARLQTLILATLIFELHPSATSDLLEVMERGVEKIGWVFDIVIEEGLSKVVTESGLDNCLGVTLVEGVLSAWIGTMPLQTHLRI